MSNQNKWLAGAVGFLLGRATAPAAAPPAPAYQPPSPPAEIPESENEWQGGRLRIFDPKERNVYQFVGLPAEDSPPTAPRLGRRRPYGLRADYLYWLGPGMYGIAELSDDAHPPGYTFREGPGWVLLRNLPGWNWEISGPTLDLEQLREAVLAEWCKDGRLAASENWGTSPEQHLAASSLYEPGTTWDATGEPTVPIPYAWASELGFTEPNPFQSGWATAPEKPAEPAPLLLSSSVAAARAPRPLPLLYPSQAPPTEEEVERRENEWVPFDPIQTTPWRPSTRLPVYPRMGRRRPDGYRADYLYWLEADAYCFPQFDGFDELRVVGPGWVVVRDEPGWGWEISEPTTDVAELEHWLWAKSPAPRHVMASWNWGLLLERALPEHALGGEGVSWFPDDDPLRHLPTNWAESLSLIVY